MLNPAALPTAAPRTGVGVLYNRSLAHFIRTDLDAADFVEIIPDTLRTDRGVGQAPRFIELDDQVETLDWIAARKPVIAHSVGLSIGSAALFDTEYLAELTQWHRRYGLLWHSEHLSFTRIAGANGRDHHAAVPFPVPYDEEVLQLIAERVHRIQETVPIPFLLENNVYFAAIPEQEMTEPEFLNRLTTLTGCGLLLDVHNIHTNARNHGIDSLAFLEELDLTRVIEVHVAGGAEVDGAYHDSHSGPCPDEVWSLLAAVAPRAPNLRAVTFEFEESYYPVLEAAGVREQLDRARSVLSLHG
jgi:uncharacterized protein (UPF0276 family)